MSRSDLEPAWTAERAQVLADLWLLGVSSTAIGNRLGVTKNAVVGKAKRMGLPGRPSPIRHGGGEAKRRRRVERRKALNERKEAVEPLETDWRPRGCQWIEGEPSADDRCKCGKPVVPGASYCEPHLRRTVAATAA